MNIVDEREATHSEIRIEKSLSPHLKKTLSLVTEEHLMKYLTSWKDPYWRHSSYHEYCCAWLLIERGEL